MTSNESRLWVRALGTAVLVSLAVLVVVQLEHSRPRAPSDAILAGVADLTQEVLTCRRGGDEPDPDVAAPTTDARVTSTALVECPFRFDGEQVTYVGEAVGDLLHRGGGAWVQLNDDPYALEIGPLPASGEFAGYSSGISVWLEGDLVDVVTRTGGPDWRGDVVRIEGVVHRADPADGGGLTIRANEAQILAAAEPLERPFHPAQAIAAAILTALAVAVLVSERATRRSR